MRHLFRHAIVVFISLRFVPLGLMPAPARKEYVFGTPFRHSEEVESDFPQFDGIRF